MAIAIVGTLVVAVIIVVTIYQSPRSSQSQNPAGYGRPAPQINLMYEGSSYEGQLLGSTLSENQFSPKPRPISAENVTSVSSKEISLQKGRYVTFELSEGGSVQTRPDSISVNVYSPDGRALGVLGTKENSMSANFIADLPMGKYVLMATATWNGDSVGRSTAGYVLYGYRISIE